MGPSSIQIVDGSIVTVSTAHTRRVLQKTFALTGPLENYRVGTHMWVNEAVRSKPLKSGCSKMYSRPSLPILMMSLAVSDIPDRV